MVGIGGAAVVVYTFLWKIYEQFLENLVNRQIHKPFFIISLQFESYFLTIIYWHSNWLNIWIAPNMR